MHKIWRKHAKKERRRRIRIKSAKSRDSENNVVDNPELSKEINDLEAYELYQIQKKNQEEHLKWLKAEEITLSRWLEIQKNSERLLKIQIEKEQRIKLELQQEKERRIEEEKKLKEIEEENMKKQQVFMEKLNQFIAGNAHEPPAELTIFKETKPNSELCPFFSKTGCCRFGDQCSRNHQYPGISNVLLAANFYLHFGLENASFSEYDTDVMLEYEDNDTYQDFKEFFYDVLPEFQIYGKVVQFKVCKNYEKHLRGNMYVEYSDVRSAVAAYQALHTRWYGGRQLSLQFCRINSWKNAICGLQSKLQCPKGRSCNFMHVFKNPSDLFNLYYNPKGERRTHRYIKSPTRSWRWSESPERELPKRREEKPSNRSEKHKKRDRSSERRRRRKSSH